MVTLGVIWSFQVFDLSYLMTGGGPGKATVTLVMSIYNSAFKQSRMGYACAQAMFLLAVVIVVNIMEDKVIGRGRYKNASYKTKKMEAPICLCAAGAVPFFHQLYRAFCLHGRDVLHPGYHAEYSS